MTSSNTSTFDTNAVTSGMGTKGSTSKPSTILDLLPRHVNEHIAAFVGFSGAVHLAKTSAQQRNAVLNTYGTSLLLPNNNKPVIHGRSLHFKEIPPPQEVVQYAHVLGSDITQVELEHGCVPNDFILDLLHRPTLVHVSVPAHAELLSALAQTQLRSLHVHVPVGDDFVLSDFLKRAQVSELSLDCLTRSMIKCALDVIVENLPEASSKLRKLSLSCIGHMHPAKLWEILPQLPDLTDLTVSSVPPEDLIPLLQKFESFRLVMSEEYGNVSDVMSRIGKPVKAVMLAKGWERLFQDEMQLRTMLENCPELCELRTEILLQTERALLHLPRQVHALHLCGACTLEFADGGGRVEPTHHPGTAAGLLCLVLRRLYCLRELSLLKLNISLHDLEEILEAVGTGLHSFAFSIDLNEGWQRRFVWLLDSIHMHCRRLRKLEIDNMGPVETPAGSEQTLGEQAAGEIEECRFAVERLFRRFPRIEITASRNCRPELRAIVGSFSSVQSSSVAK